MTPSQKAVACVLLFCALVGGFFWYSQHRTDLETKDAVRGEKISVAEVGATVTRHAFDSVSQRLDSVSRVADANLMHWDTVTKKVERRVEVPVPGEPGKTVTRVDSVFKDSAFAALSDSDKVKVLRLLGDENAKVCRALISTCQAARDTATKLIAAKDTIIHLWQQRYEDKPRRRCGFGAGLGIIAGVSSTLQPISGVGGSLGLSCSL